MRPRAPRRFQQWSFCACRFPFMGWRRRDDDNSGANQSGTARSVYRLVSSTRLTSKSAVESRLRPALALLALENQGDGRNDQETGLRLLGTTLRQGSDTGHEGCPAEQPNYAVSERQSPFRFVHRAASRTMTDANSRDPS